MQCKSCLHRGKGASQIYHLQILQREYAFYMQVNFFPAKHPKDLLSATCISLFNESLFGPYQEL